jgi:ribosome-associated protein
MGMDIKIRDGEDFIRLGQALKKAGLAGSGSDAKALIQDGAVKVNGEAELRRGRKLYPDDNIFFEGETVRIIK